INRYYKDAEESPLYYKDINSIERDFPFSSHNRIFKKDIAKKMMSEKAFSMYAGDNKIVSFIPLKNIEDKKVVAYFKIYSDNKQIEAIFFSSNIFKALVVLLTFIFLYIFHRAYKNRLVLETTQKELQELNHNLEKKIATEIEKNRKKDQQLIEHSRLAQMGEMISMIAHQWRQPLSAIAAVGVHIELQAMLNTLDNKTVIIETKKIAEYVQHLSTTIDDFRNFFKKDKEQKDISMDAVVHSSLNIIEASISDKGITIIKELNSDKLFKSYPNELKQVVLNLLKNAEDILIEKEMKNPTITICTEDFSISVSDNAGGVPEEIITKIFTPYFSTKLEKNGTGLGLYMSKTIIEDHCKGSLSVKNDESGAVFTIKL
ncbi:MAG: ATP-binding protein, partial [Campylobacterota bacterium]|nr:ATP-binding protein [Campylobacterota bacterium]